MKPTSKPFTDEDLAKLKKHLDPDPFLIKSATDDFMGREKTIAISTVLALISRLEAAENAIFASDDGPEIDAWRKAAGK